jgi:cation diffusion facilitator family transporter
VGKKKDLTPIYEEICMHIHTLDQWRHSHDFPIDTAQGEKRTSYVVMLTTAMMVVEIAAGYLFGSMALLADGWHMGTHVAALGISLFAYRYARQHSGNPYFNFGTGKVSSLGGFASAAALAVVALWMGLESLQRLLSPQQIHFDEAILVAAAGLGVNLLSAWLLGGARSHDPHQRHAAHHHDHNLRAAYLHVLADALTSLLAILALLCGRAVGWVWMDALVGVVGAVVISQWSLGLVRETSGVLLDATPDRRLASAIRNSIESDADNRISDLHLWRVGPNHFAVIVSLVTHQPRDPAHYKALLHGLSGLGHITVEVNHCPGETCA